MTTTTVTTRSAAPSTYLAPRVAAKSASLALAAVMTLAVLVGLDTLASRDHATLQPELAQAAASAPRS